MTKRQQEALFIGGSFFLIAIIFVVMNWLGFDRAKVRHGRCVSECSTAFPDKTQKQCEFKCTYGD